MTKQNPNTYTKKLISDKIVRHYLIDMSAITSDILSYLAQLPLECEFHHTLSDGLIYFSGDSPLEQMENNSPKNSTHASTQEVIALLPKALLTACTRLDGIHIVRSERQDHDKYKQFSKTATAADYFTELQTLPYSDTEETRHNPSNGCIQFTGGLAGFIGYDLAASQHSVIPKHDSANSEQLVAAMGVYDIYLKKEAGEWALYGPNDPALNPFFEKIITALQTIKTSTSLTAADQNKSNSKSSKPFHVLKPFTPVWSGDDYAHAFRRIQEYLRAGDCYQVNLTQPFIAKVKGDLFTILDDLLQLTQAPYSGYMRVGEHEILSCSPELFLSFSGIGNDHHNRVITRPIKGTRPRSNNIVDDDIERKALIHSEKDHSENLMIVDLLRHDLSRHAVVGSVEVPALFELESFAQVHHLVSEVRATLRQDVSALDVLIDALPGGSITGAPKIRAMEIIGELEAMPRGAYCGSFGYLNRDGSGQFNVLIRTLQKYQDNLTAWAGGGITIASNVDAEYQECFDKISAILNCVNEFT